MEEETVTYEDGMVTIHFDPPIVLDVNGQEWTVNNMVMTQEEYEEGF